MGNFGGHGAIVRREGKVHMYDGLMYDGLALGLLHSSVILAYGKSSVVRAQHHALCAFYSLRSLHCAV